MSAESSNTQLLGARIDSGHHRIFTLLHRNSSRRLRALVLLDLKHAKARGRLEALLALYPDDEDLRRAVEGLPE